MSAEPWQILSDCPHCLVEAAVVETVDPVHPASHFGRASETRCRMCGWQILATVEPFAPRTPISAGRCPACTKPLSEGARTGTEACGHCAYAPTFETTVQPADLRDPERALAALVAWAIAEGEPDVAVFTRANLGDEPAAIVARLGARERVGSQFDVIAFLFPQMAGGSPPSGREATRSLVDRHGDRVVDRAPVESTTTAPSVAPPVVDDRRNAMRVLVSVMVADGELQADELSFVQAFLAREQLPAFTPDDLRVWRPADVAIADPALRERVLEAAVALAHLDRMRDGSEHKVIAAYAKAWGVRDDRLAALDRRYEARYGTALTRLFRLLSSLVRLK